MERKKKAAKGGEADPSTGGSLAKAAIGRATRHAEMLGQRLRHTGINRAIVALGVFLVVIYTLTALHRHGDIMLPAIFVDSLRTITLVAGAYLIASLVVRVTADRVTKAIAEFEIEQRLLLGKTYAAVIYLFATLFILWRLGVTLQNITLFFGLAATGVGFAIRDIITSYFAWFMLLTKKPFRIGDYIQIGEEEGQVRHIGTFYVLLDDSPERYEDFVRVPNRLFLEKPIRNFGRDRFQYTVRIPLGAVKDLPKGLEQRLGKAKTAATKAAGGPIAFFLDADKERIVLEIKGYAASYPERDALRDALLRAVLSAMR